MKPISYFPAFLHIIILLLFLTNCKDESNEQTQKNIEQRPNITFILGEDKEIDNPFYEAAAEFYRKNDQEKTTEMILSCRSLAEVSLWLNAHKSPQNQPWGIINLVVHGNPWVGCRIGTEGKRIDAKGILKEIESNAIAKIKNGSVDELTEIRLVSCGLGHDKELLKAIGQAFTSKNTVRSPYYFMVFDKQKGNRYLAEYWYVTATSTEQLPMLFSQKFPKITINWADALTRTMPRQEEDAYSYRFSIPFKWSFQLKDKSEIPVIKDENQCVKWLEGKKEIQSKLQEINFQITDFQWQYWTEYEPDNPKPIFKVKGLCPITCVLKTFPQQATYNWSNNQFYQTVN